MWSSDIDVTFGIYLSSETSYSPEELLAMVLEKAREYAQDFAGMLVKFGRYFFFLL